VLQVGIDDYQYVDKLHGCVQDVVDMKELLIKKFDVPADHFLTLTNQEATHDAILSAFRKQLIENAKRHREAIVIFQYSGHGSRVPDQNGDKADGLDSTLVPVNSRDPEGKNFDIVDDEIRELFDELSRYTSNISFIIDACHSGNPTRGGAKRGIGIDTRRQPPEKTKPARTRSGVGLRGGEMTTVLPRDQRYVSLVATQPSESANEKTVVEGQKTNGALTFHLLRALERATPETTYRELMEEVASAVTADFASQHPQLEGDLRRSVFAGSANREDIFIRIEEVNEKQVTIAAGLAQGIQPGTIVAIYAPEARRLVGDDKRLAVGAVTEVGPFSAKIILKDTSSISVKAKAVVVSADFASSRMRVVLDSGGASTRTAAASDSGLARVAELLKDNRKISLVDDSISTGAAAASRTIWDVAVRRDKFANAFKDRGERGCADTVEIPAADQEVFFLADQTGRPLFDFFVKAQDAAGPQKIVTALDYLVNQRALRSIRNERSQLKGGIKINVLRVSGDFTASPPRVEREELVSLSTDQQDYRFDQCEYFRFEIENHSGKDLYITLFDLGTDGSIQILYPPKGGTMLIPNGEKVKPNMFLQTTGPSGYETFKIIATTEKKGPSDFAFLEQAGVGATRTKTVSVAEFADWTTTQLNFVIGNTVKR
jgi:caspase domain-containing protein